MKDSLVKISNNNEAQVIRYLKPSELLGMFSSYLSQQEMNRQVIFLQGIYLKNPKHDPKWQSRYDTLRDEDTQTEITLQIPLRLADNLKDGNLVTVGGVLGKKVLNNSHIQLLLVVSRIDVLQETAISEDEIKRMELRRKKGVLGFKNVDSLLEQKLFSDERPKVALVFATTSITKSDFNAEIKAAMNAIDFAEHRVNFSSPAEFSELLKQLDTQGYDAISLVRGGGVKVESTDDLTILETVVNMKTPVIVAIGHVDEKLFIKQLADKEVPTPSGLGQYFSEMVENVSEKKTKSRAVLTEQIKKQFKEQLEAGQKQNKELQAKLAKLTKAQETANQKHSEQVKALTEAQKEANKQHKEQVASLQKQQKELTDKANKQNEELQKKLAEITKINESAQKIHAEQLEKLQVQLQEQTKTSSKQSAEFNENLKKMQEANGELNKSVQRLTAQNAQAAKDLQMERKRALELEKQLGNSGNSKIWMAIAIIASLALIFLLLNKL